MAGSIATSRQECIGAIAENSHIEMTAMRQRESQRTNWE